MVICQYFLRGNCKFGDRCYNEHRRPENQGSHRQGGRGQRNYHQESRNFNNNSRHDNFNKSYQEDEYYSRNNSYGNRNFNNRDSSHYNQRNRNRRNQDADIDYKYGHQNNNYSERRNFNRDKYHYDARNKNHYSALADEIEPERQRFDHSRGRSHSTTSQQTVKPLEQKLEKTQRDMIEWDKNGQWPFSCYSPFANEPCVNGLMDISPEETRAEAYKAKNEGNTVNYEQKLAEMIQIYRRRKLELATMSLSALEDEMSGSSEASMVPGGLFGNLATVPVTSNDKNSFFDDISITSTSVFGHSHSNTNPTSPFSTNTNPLNPSMMASSPFDPTARPLQSTPSATSQVNMMSVTSIPKTEVNVATGHQTSATGLRSLTSSRCSEKDLKAFRASQFVMGAVPECPPPLELC